MKRRWRLAIAAGGVLAAAVLAPVAYIEGGCRAPLAGAPGEGRYRPLLPSADRRRAAQTFLTYPEWHIVYEAEAYARHLAAGRPPSAFPFWSQVGRFWRSYCAVNRLTRASASASDYKITIYTIGVSFTAELAVKAIYERTIGRFTEWASGWTSADDRYAAGVQRRYGAFLHETPWYRFPFGEALAGAWRTHEPALRARHWERRFANSAEYGAKALYAGAIDWATGATVGRDAPTLRFVARGLPPTADPRLKRVAQLPGGLTVVQAPRYQQFNDLLGKLAASDVQLVEIAGNRTIFATLLLPPGSAPPAPALLDMPIDRPGWRRVGVALPVPDLLAAMRRTRTAGGEVEHVYDY